MKRIVLLLLVGGLLPYLAGCVGSHTFSNAARAGDTVAVAVGSTNGANHINPADVSVEVIDSVGAHHPVKLRSLVRLYADPLSSAARFSFPPYGNSSGSIAYEGQWMALVDLVAADNTVPSIATGSATLQLTHSDPAVDLYDPALTIIAGTGTPHPLSDNNNLTLVSFLNTAPYIGVQTNGVATAAPGGATFVIRYDATKFPYTLPSKFSQDPNVQMLYGEQELPGGFKEMKVVILNPKGFDSANNDDSALGKSLLKDLMFVLSWGNTQQPILGTDLTLVSSEYIDIDGNAIPELSASFYGGFGYIE